MAAKETPADERTALLLQETEDEERNGADCFCLGVVRDEFRCRNFGLDYPTEDVFYKSQWRWPRLLFLLFRGVLAIYTVTIIFLTICYFPSKTHRPWPIYMTNWSYMLLTIHQVNAFVIALLHMRDSSVGLLKRDRLETASKSKSTGQHRKNSPTIPCYMKFDWLVFTVASVSGIYITGEKIRMLVDYPSMVIPTLTAKDINNHYINGLVILLEFCVCAIPFRLFHVIYCVMFYFIYDIFSAILWATDHDKIIYPTLDWNNPDDALKYVFHQALAKIPVYHLGLFLLYVLRRNIAEKCCNRKQDGDRQQDGDKQQAGDRQHDKQQITVFRFPAVD